MIAGIRAAQAAGVYSDAQKRGWQTRVKKGTAVSGAKGKHWTLSAETRLNSSARQRPEKSRLWKGGLTDKNKLARKSVEWKLWREAIFERDNYTCQFCGIRGGVELHPHHIKPYSKFPGLKYEVRNGVTLCRGCHLTTPSFGARVRDFNYIAA